MSHQDGGGKVAAMRAAREAQWARAQKAAKVGGKAAAVADQVAELAPLTPPEMAELEVLKDRVRSGLRTFFDVAAALTEIRDRRLYRQTHRSWDAFVNDEFGMTKQHANRQIIAAAVVGNLGSGTRGSALPTQEKVIRPLTPLEPKQQRKAWKMAVKKAAGGKITNEIVQEAVQEVTGAPKPEPSCRVCPNCGWAL